VLEGEEGVLESYGRVCKRGVWDEEVKQVEAERPRIYDEIFVIWERGAGLVRRDADPELAVPTL
jgi:hypothetical protein